MSLEAFQSGLSWITILRKRPAFREAFAGFHIADVARFDESDVLRLMADAGIVRNRLKIDATMSNARVALELDGGWMRCCGRSRRSSADARPTRRRCRR